MLYSRYIFYYNINRDVVKMELQRRDKWFCEMDPQREYSYTASIHAYIHKRIKLTKCYKKETDQTVVILDQLPNKGERRREKKRGREGESEKGGGSEGREGERQRGRVLVSKLICACVGMK